MRRIFFAIVLMALSSNIHAQIAQTARYEVERKIGDENFIVIGAKDNGILLIRESKEKVANANGNIWQIVRLDNGLTEQWDTKLVIDYKHVILGYEYFDGNLYLLFEKEFSGRKKEFYILKIDEKDGANEKFEISTDLEIEPTHLLINDEQMVLGGEINYRLTFIVLNFKKNKVTVVPGFFNPKIVILDFNYNKEHKAYSLLLAEKNSQNRNQLIIKSFNKNGKVFIDENYLFDEEIRALNGKVEIGNDMKVYFSGSYGGFKSYYSQGIYFGILEGGKPLKMQFHHLTKFDHLLDYMSEKRAKKITTKIEKGIRRDKPYELKTQLWVQDFKEYPEYFSLLSDIYRPEFDEGVDIRYGVTDDSDNNTNQKYVSYTSGISNVNGSTSVKYHESILMLISKQGKLLHDMSLPTPGAEALVLDKLSAAYVSDKGAYILYKDENNFRYKLFDNSSTSLYDSLQQTAIFANNSRPIKMTDQEGKVEYWYDNHFFVWGYQRIEDESARKRTVFYINKITIEE